ncbi:hypothetical protein QOK74_08275 [Staphylococcus saprophyticus]|uniref:hypothetical protein n=1 Tax=Staphylococcus saprophyticus TaxID=29385 RepID=UPI0024C29DA3|nr:hypothetical protein [Staphylococcus saprophyticus]MDK1672867.1 hypothetical protein [Staphylococcus saprophyticus]
MMNLTDEKKKELINTLYIDYEYRNNSYRVIYYELYKHIKHINNEYEPLYHLVEHAKVFNSICDLDFIKLNFEKAYKVIVNKTYHRTLKQAYRRIINNHDYLTNVNHNEITKYNNIELLFNEELEKEKVINRLSEFLSLEIGIVKHEFNINQISLIDEINNVLLSKFNIYIEYEYREDKTICIYKNK